MRGIGLPGMEGHELAKRPGAAPAAASSVLIALTGYGRPHDRESARAAGLDHHFVKPIDIGQLDQVLEQVVLGESDKPPAR
jgi:CheY-like chemotaxis protein